MAHNNKKPIMVVLKVMALEGVIIIIISNSGTDTDFMEDIYVPGVNAKCFLQIDISYYSSDITLVSEFWIIRGSNPITKKSI